MTDPERIDGRRVIVGERAEEYPSFGLTIYYEKKLHAEKYHLQDLLQRIQSDIGKESVSMLFYQQGGWCSESEPEKWENREWSYITAVWKYGSGEFDNIKNVNSHLRLFRSKSSPDQVANSNIKTVEYRGDEKRYF